MSNPNSLPNSEKISINPCQKPEKKPASSFSYPEGAQDVTEIKRITIRDDSKSCRFFIKYNLRIFLGRNYWFKYKILFGLYFHNFLKTLFIIPHQQEER